ncbi:MAG: hypothetical protein NWS69_04290 [Pseudomonadales bacterium]|jgi:hypothetical protein|nr:hypothetical protein [Pseudomonadales bacterium]
MSKQLPAANKEAITVAVVPSFNQRVTGLLHDPIASAFAATFVTIMAIGFVISGLWLINFMLY